MVDGNHVLIPDRTQRSRLALALTGALCAAAPRDVGAQTGLPPAPRMLTLPARPIDQGIADRGPDAISLRHVDIDLREDNEFDRVYTAPGRSDLLMRRRGAITAVFPESVYARRKGGMIPVIPPGTIFLIGLPVENDPAFPMTVGAAPSAREGSESADRRNSAPLSAPIDARISSAIFSPSTLHPAPDDLVLLAELAAERERQRRLREIAARLAPSDESTPRAQ